MTLLAFEILVVVVCLAELGYAMAEAQPDARNGSLAPHNGFRTMSLLALVVASIALILAYRRDASHALALSVLALGWLQLGTAIFYLKPRATMPAARRYWRPLAIASTVTVVGGVVLFVFPALWWG